VRAKIHLIRLQSSEILQTAQKVQSLVELTRFFEAHKDAMYTVAWIDCTQTGSRLGRSVFFAGEHGQERGKLEVHKKKSVPFPSIPFPVVFPWNIKVFNHLYYSIHASHTKPKHVHYDPFFFPLDRIGNWNRMYGRKGFIQYQCVFPKSVGLDPMVEVLTKVAKSGRSSFLAVLKYFGPENQNFLSFPMEGWTLSLDFMLHRELFELLTECDTIVARAGGRVYLAKDARLSKSHFQAMYPKFQHVMQIRNKYSIENLHSLQSERLGF
ncbi:MAG: hypothetical protein KDD46_08095, partial [Bdellovibrionales bacterium]|nr:hypothetical protein [Bdellovibrionales bacterium]